MNRQAVAQPQAKIAPSINGDTLQRMCACGQHTGGAKCEGCRSNRKGLQRQPGNGAKLAGVPTIVREVLRSPGQPLDTAIRAFIEPRLGYDFSHVRVHTGPRAEESARAVNALAYTGGSNIVFGRGSHALSIPEGRGLLAHELVHVVQQTTLEDPQSWSTSTLAGHEKVARQAGEIVAKHRPVTHRGTGRRSPAPSRSVGRVPLQRFASKEHRSLGDEATQNALVNLGGEDPDHKFELRHGDVIALSGDYFDPDELMQLGSIPGKQGSIVGSRDEIIFALWDIDVNEPPRNDERFKPGGVWFWAEQAFSSKKPSNGVSDVKESVGKRYRKLAAENTRHFVSPRGRDAKGVPLPTKAGEKSAGASYRSYHESALRMAYRFGREGFGLPQAMAREAAAQHFLTDAFSAGHLRTPIGDIREYWRNKYRLFWSNLLNKIALDTAIAINSTNSAAAYLASVQTIYEEIVQQVEGIAKNLPEISLGDLLAIAFHDFENKIGVSIAGGKIFGDEKLDTADPQNVTRKAAVEAIHAGNKDVQEAYSLGISGAVLEDNGVYEAVRKATGASPDAYVAETLIPRPEAGNPTLNWQAPTFEILWDKPIVGSVKPPAGITVGQQIQAELQPGNEVRSQLDQLAEKFPETGKLGARPRQAYRDGFIKRMVANAKAAVLSIIHWAPSYGLRSTDRDDVSLATGQKLQERGDLKYMTTQARALYIRELIDGVPVGSEEELVVQIFATAPAAERAGIYRLVEGHNWQGDWIEGITVPDDDIWNALNRKRLARVKLLINESWNKSGAK